MLQAAWLLGGAAFGLFIWSAGGKLERSRRTDLAYRAAEVAVVLTAIVLSIFPVQSEDIFIHLAVGRRFFAEGHFPDPDPFLFTLRNYYRGWTDVWASHLLAYLTYRAGGFPALVLAKTAIVAVAAIAPLWLARRLGFRTVMLPAVILLALWTACPRFVERASTISDVAGAWVLALCLAELAKPSRYRRWILPFLFLLWTNLHPGVLTGIGIVGAMTLARLSQWRRFVPLLVACISASCIHPNGPKTLLWGVQGILGGRFDVFRRYIYEFLPTLDPINRGRWPVTLFLVLSGAVTVLLLLDSRRKKSERLFRLLCLAALLYLGFSTRRFMTTAALALPVLVASMRPVAIDERRGFTGSALAAAVGLLLAIKVAVWGYQPSFTPARHLGLGADARIAPVRAADFVSRLPLIGGIFNQWGRGGFLAWQWDGEPKIYCHGYVQDQEFFRNDYHVPNSSKQEFDRIVEKYDIDVVFFDRSRVSTRSGLRKSLTYRPDWRLVYFDNDTTVFLRVRPEYRETLEEYEYRYANPLEPNNVIKGMREDRARVRREALRLYRDGGRNSVVADWVRRFLRESFGENPDARRSYPDRVWRGNAGGRARPHDPSSRP